MRTTSEKEINAILRLDGPARFAHFVKRVVDQESAWALWKEGWSLMADSEGRYVFPLWPAPEYAERCRAEEWSSYEPEEIPLEALLDELPAKVSAKGIHFAVFPTPGGAGVTVSAEELCSALRKEMAKYE